MHITEGTYHDIDNFLIYRPALIDPIPEAVKEHLPKPLKAEKYRPIPPPQNLKKQKETKKRKVILEEFDPIPIQNIRTVQDYQKEISQLLEEQPDRLEF